MNRTAASDVEQIRRLVADLAWYIDTGDTEAGLALFTSDALLDASTAGGGLISGPQGLRAFMEGTYTRAPSRLHVVSNHVVDVEEEGDRAAGRLVGLAYTKNPDGVSALVGIAYEDHYERDTDGWKIARRVVTPMVVPER
ncbi:nuclear transport factor 2 family protein [Streptomyces sp. NPDC051985]|uniref:nuclear transport factor 2 family protein n=1 Tax=Streptomyces sp. NPDC051985 TaxID=3155807 RepID=UPI00342ABBFC